MRKIKEISKELSEVTRMSDDNRETINEHLDTICFMIARSNVGDIETELEEVFSELFEETTGYVEAHRRSDN